MHLKTQKSHRTYALLCALCFGLLTGCTSDDVADETNRFNDMSQCNTDGIVLEENSVELYLEADSDEIQITDDFLMTNTKQIVVTSADSEQSAEIELFLYSYESAGEPIGYATLSENNATVTFSNLTSDTTYKVGGKINSSTISSTLNISD